ncbi:queuine tRNA-ribosyltransferase accessory subunit 2 [Petromyzon marinus]|uniref:queuine tRNA-ribosyltransferase accessory subunit 2 n=1 Tax=Petromyzon marinus TaxID=7757 RepID=UPI003F706E43
MAMAMRLKLSSAVAGCRVGELLLGGRSLELPACLLYTRGGTAPNLTHDNLELVEPPPLAAQVPLASLVEQQEVLEEYGEGFAKFIGLPDMLLVCTQYDPATPTPQGFTTSKTVSVWGSGGRVELTPSRYVELQRAVRPACYQAPAADDEGPTASSKRERRGVDRTLAFLDACLLAHHTHPELSGVGVLGTVQGGALMSERVRSARCTATRAVAGFLVSGLFQRQGGEGGPGAATRSRILRAVIAELPPDKPRMVCGVGRPDQVLRCAALGVDLFESHFPFLVTERGGALHFSYEWETGAALGDAAGEEGDDAGGSVIPEVTQEEEEDEEEEDVRIPTRFEMNLREERFRGDLSPLLPGCPCYTCAHHSRAYLHHLLATRELLAGVLLSIHNVTRYHGFFAALRGALRRGPAALARLRGAVLAAAPPPPLSSSPGAPPSLSPVPPATSHG